MTMWDEIKDLPVLSPDEVSAGRIQSNDLIYVPEPDTGVVWATADGRQARFKLHVTTLPKEEHVGSSRDDSTVNNLMRHEYRVLTDEDKRQMTVIKDIGLKFVDLLHQIDDTAITDRLSSRELALAQTKIEEAVMWAVKHITR